MSNCVSASQSAIENQRQEYVMTTLDDTLTAIGRQLSVAYLPTVLEPLPRELNHLVAQLVAFEARSNAHPADSSESDRAERQVDPRSE
jgi:hypothetical protein